MRVGIGLPTLLPGDRPTIVADWARLAEDCGFSSIATIDRLAYPNCDPFVSLAATAAVTSRVNLVTSILLGPIRADALLAKQAASLDFLSGGRLHLGLGVGVRAQDYLLAGSDFGCRGELLDRQVDALRRMWPDGQHSESRPIAPALTDSQGPRILFGGSSAAALRRVVRYRAGWIYGGVGIEKFERLAREPPRVLAGRRKPGQPRMLDAHLFSRSGRGWPRRWLSRGHYAGDPFLDALVKDTPTTADAVRQAAAEYAAAGCEELMLFPCTSSLAQAELLAAAALAI